MTGLASRFVAGFAWRQFERPTVIVDVDVNVVGVSERPGGLALALRGVPRTTFWQCQARAGPTARGGI